MRARACALPSRRCRSPRTRRRRSSASSSRPRAGDRALRARCSRPASTNLAARGIALVDAFPWNAGPDDTKATDHYHGTLSMFTDAGFAPIATHENVTVVRKIR